MDRQEYSKETVPSKNKAGEKDSPRRKVWQGKQMRVEILYSLAGIATQIQVMDKKTGDWLLLDCGDGTLRDSLQRGVDLGKLRGVLISHGHGDHMSGLLALFWGLRIVHFRGELKIFAPKFCREVRSVVDFFGRSEYHGDLFVVDYEELDCKELDSETLDEKSSKKEERKATKETVEKMFKEKSIADFQVNYFPAVHYDTLKRTKTSKTVPLQRKPALSYSIQLRGEKVLYSGDSILNNRLKMEVEGVDLALLEATYSSVFQEESVNHLHIEEARELGKKAKDFLLVHRSDLE